jgi:OOP family OmpA-OmpF porin
MIRILRSAAGWLAIVMAAAVLAGCSSSSSGASGGTGSDGAATLPPCLVPREPVALAIGVRSNNPTPSLTQPGQPVVAAMNSAIAANKQITIIRIDGSPSVIFSQTFNPIGANSQSRKTDYDNYITEMNDVLAGTTQAATDIRAQAPQADVLTALSEAASEVPAGGNVIVMDSGLQTVSPLNFTEGLLSDDPQTIVDYMKSADELPNLSARHVYFVGLGWTAAPQPSLGIAYRKKAVAIWEQIAKAAGATCATADPAANTAAAVPGLPPVSVVTPPPLPPPPASCSVAVLNDANHVGFDFASTTFRDPAGARATLKQLAVVLLRTGESVVLTGSTSSEGSEHFNQVLSLQRAEAVKAVLVQLGVPASRITTYGDGSHLPGRVNDRGPNGQLLIGPAIQDRKVVAKLTGKDCQST